MTISLPWTKFQDFYLRLGFLKTLVAALGAERRSAPVEAILRRLRRPLFESVLLYPDLAARVGEKMPWYGSEWWRGTPAQDKAPTVAEALVVEANLQSFLFAITAPTTYKIVDWGRNVGLVGRGNQITERGLTLHALFDADAAAGFLSGKVDHWNPFRLSMIEKIFFLYHLVEIDQVTLTLIDAIGRLPDEDIETIDAAKMLAAALSLVLSNAERSVRPPEIPALRTALELAATICEELDMPPPPGAGDPRRRTPRLMNPATRRKAIAVAAAGGGTRRTHKNADHQTVPRFEQLVDLDFLSKPGAENERAPRRRWKWRPTDVARRWVSARTQLNRDDGPFLWNGFARAACYAYREVAIAEPRRDTTTIATYLAKGYRSVRRAIGHTPFDSVALMAMAHGAVDGLAIEMVDLHRLMLSIKSNGWLQGEVFFASGNDLDKMFVSLRDDFAERAIKVLPDRITEDSIASSRHDDRKRYGK